MLIYTRRVILTNLMPRKRLVWENLSDAELLDVRLCDLGVKLEGTWLERPLDELLARLERRHVRVKPHVWLSDEWMCPDACIGFGLPFYLTHPRLMRLERRFMSYVEGGTHRWATQLMRHETGHVMCNAYKLHHRAAWRQVFGSPSQPYPKVYRPNPRSRHFVQHLEDWYAQCHPDEDFAETFAVWLSSRLGWRRRYAGWPALKKLEYVDELMAEVGDQPSKIRYRDRPFPLREMRQTLRDYYYAKQERYGMGFPSRFEPHLRRIFVQGSRGVPAARVLRTHRQQVVSVARAHSRRVRQIPEHVVDAMITRCRELGLRSVGSPRSVADECGKLAARCAAECPETTGAFAV